MSANLEQPEVCFLNRDHIISVVVHQSEVVVTTTAGEKITFPASADTIAKFADDLANAIQSNFVSIAAASPSTAAATS
jgi:hypothetical protein